MFKIEKNRKVFSLIFESGLYQVKRDGVILFQSENYEIARSEIFKVVDNA